MKPEEARPKEQILLIDKQLAELEARFNQLKSDAEKQFTDKKYSEALALFDKALEIHAGDQAVVARQNEIRALMMQSQERDATYSALLADADQKFTANQLADARIKYVEAGQVKPEEARPKEQILLIDSRIQSQKKIDEQVSLLIQQGDKFLADSLPDDAITVYRQALALFPDYEIANAKIEEAGLFKASLAKAEADYNNFIVEADKYYNEQRFDEASEFYNLALNIKPSAIHPRNRMEAIEAERLKTRSIAENYQKALQEGNDLATLEKFQGAIESFRKAMIYKPGDSIAFNRIAQIEQILNERQDREQAYKGLIELAGGFYQKNELQNAVEKYKEAQLLFPERTLAGEQIAKIENELNSIKEKQNNYDNLIAKGDQLLSEQQYDASRNSYNASLQFCPNCPYPVNQIRIIDSTLMVQAKFEQQFQDLVNRGDQLFKAGNYLTSRELYVKASEVQPNNKYPQLRIATIDSLNEASSQQLKIYDELIVNANNYYQQSIFDEAYALYVKANGIFPNEQLPKQRMIEIENRRSLENKNQQLFQEKMTQAEEFFRNKYYREAVETFNAARIYTKDPGIIENRIHMIDSILTIEQLAETRYLDAIKNGDIAFNTGDYENSRAAFQEALNIRPEQSYPSEKIASINQIFANRKAAIESAYNQAIGDADKLLAAEHYEESIKAYQRALEHIAADSYALSKIEYAQAANEALKNKKISYQLLISNADALYNQGDLTGALKLYSDALEVFPLEPYPANQRDLITLKINERIALETKFNSLIAKADILFDQEDFLTAASIYEEAILLKADQYASERLATSKRYFSEINQKKKIYADFIAFGDNYLKINDFRNAIRQYEMAFNILPMRKEAVDKKENAIRLWETEKSTFEGYRNSIRQADSLAGTKKYNEAIAMYDEALTYKPNDNYAIKKKQDIIKQIADHNQRVKDYERYMQQADSLYALEELRRALPFYEKAARLFPEDEYPKARISEIAGILNQPASGRGISYLDLIRKGDSCFVLKRYEKSTDYYNLAQQVKPTEEYPVIKLQETFEIVSSADKHPLLSQNTRLYNEETAKVGLPANIVQKDRKQYLIIRTEAADTSDVKLIINYGDKYSGNGGFVCRVPVSGGYGLFVGSLTDQNGWLFKPTDWMNFYAENGNIVILEISIITLP